jgi:hypothetical protein|tara:strand:- start:111 stop:245 length:135 start_codon:yes stop_codon:yes gene_type:complete
MFKFIENILAKIGGPVWRGVQTTKHATLGAIIVVLVIGLIVWVV